MFIIKGIVGLVKTVVKVAVLAAVVVYKGATTAAKTALTGIKWAVFGLLAAIGLYRGHRVRKRVKGVERQNVALEERTAQLEQALAAQTAVPEEPAPAATAPAVPAE
jgi:hypothetical protein